MLTIDCISDLHGHYPELEGGDLLIVAGDLTGRDEVNEYFRFGNWINSQPYEHIVIVGGNHDNRISDGYTLAYALDGTGIQYLCDYGMEIEGLKIWGSPWTSQFPGINPKCCAFTRPFMTSLKDRWDLIPDDVDILITHGPPYGILDTVATDYGAGVGDMHLRDALENRIKPKLHVFGHIHENGGKQLIFKRPGHGMENNTICVNASYVDERYRPVHKPVRVELSNTSK